MKTKWFGGFDVIAFIGPDGAGKTTNLTKLYDYFMNREHPLKTEIVNMHLAENTIIPITNLARGTYKKIGGNKITFKTKLIYTIGSFLYAFDEVLRCWRCIIRSNKSLIITDRWGYDIFLMKHTPFFIRKFLLRVMPTPDKTFYLYNDVEVLHERRPENTIEDLQRQLGLFDYVAKKKYAIRIKTDNDAVFETIRREVMS